MTEHDRKIMQRLHEHLQAVTDTGKEWVGIFLQGSQNYGMDTSESDIDTKAIVLPSFEDFVFNRKPTSYTHIMENDEHVDIKDIRVMFDNFKKQNINFVEILFTDYYILNPKYELFYRDVMAWRNRIARYHTYAALNCMCGMAMQKRKALCHPYPSTAEKIEKYGYDSKQLIHIERLLEFMKRWVAETPYKECLQTNQRNRLLSIKNYTLSLEEAVSTADETIAKITSLKDLYFSRHKDSVDSQVEDMLNSVIYNILRFSFAEEVTSKNKWNG